MTRESPEAAHEFLAARYPDEDRLKRKNVLSENPGLWSRVVARATSEIYDYRNWESMYTALYGNHVPDLRIPGHSDHRFRSKLDSDSGGGPITFSFRAGTLQGS